MSDFDHAVDLIQARPGQTVAIEYERNGQTFETTATLEDHNPEGKPVGFLGVGAHYPYVQPVRALRRAGRRSRRSGALTWESIKALGSFFSPSACRTTSTRCSAGLRPAADSVGVRQRQQ